jgi:hypothetical protein
MNLFLLVDVSMEPVDWLERHSAALTIMVLIVMGLLTLMVLVPRMLRAKMLRQEMQHAERMKCLEMGQVPPYPDDRSIAAGRTASLVPMVVICAAAAVTCFLSAYRPENLFAVALAAWSVAGAVSLAAITGGVALMGRLAHLHAGMNDEDEEEEAPEDEDEPRSQRRDGMTG